MPVATERHYTVVELATIWQLSNDTVRNIFWGRPGVIQLSNPKPSTRRYVTMRIPESVAQEVHRQMRSGKPFAVPPAPVPPKCATLEEKQAAMRERNAARN